MMFLLIAQTALADVAPGPLYREDCTVQKKEQEGTTCQTCSGSMSGSDTGLPECEATFADTDYTYVCKTYGASVWTEVWCDGPPRDGCAHARGGAGAALLIAGLLLTVFARRD